MTTANHAPAPTQTIGLLYAAGKIYHQVLPKTIRLGRRPGPGLAVSYLLGEFRRHYHSGDVREDVANYGMYFLGPITLMKDNATMEIIDGQQRITSIILLLIALHHRFANDSPPKTSTLPSRIYNERFGNIEFVLQAADRSRLPRIPACDRHLSQRYYNRVERSHRSCLRTYDFLSGQAKYS